LAGEGDLGDERVAGQIRANVTSAVDHVEDAIREASFGIDLCKGLAVERSEFTGLIDHRVTGSQTGCGLPKSTMNSQFLSRSREKQLTYI
jgi:hypothetical protein